MSVTPLPAGQFALGLHTSSPELGLGLSNFADTHRSQAWPLGRDLSAYLHQHLQAFLAPVTWSELAWLAVTIGPGSYTGTRMGVVTARTLAQQLDIPLFPISTLAATVWAQVNQEPQFQSQSLAVTLPAQQGHCYGAIYDYLAEMDLLKPRQADRVYTLAAWQELLDTLPVPLPVIGDNVPLPDTATITAAVLALAQQAWQQGERPHWSAALPFYGEPPVRPS